jgi:hypothetical protein
LDRKIININEIKTAQSGQQAEEDNVKIFQIEASAPGRRLYGDNLAINDLGHTNQTKFILI